MRINLLTPSLVLTLAATPSLAAPRFPLGTYTGNPDGTTPANEAAFEAQFNSFVGTMGTRPTLMNAYVDYTQDPSLWGQNAQWTAWSWSISPVVGTGMVPVLGVPLGVNWSWNDGGAFFRAIAGGTYDADYAAVIDGWSQYGYKSLYLRIGYEMNSTGVPWYAGSDPALNAEWIAAFDHVAAVMRAEAALDGVTVSIVWNPVSQNWTAMDVSTLYPGNANVDVVAVDVYSPVYPRDLTDWSQPCCVQAPSLQAWFKSNVNRQHYWKYPSANQWNPQGQAGTGWSLLNTIQLARKHGKPIAIGESGAGGDGRTNGPRDDGAFPLWLATMLGQPNTPRTLFVDVWDVALSDGDWQYTAPDAPPPKPREAKSWESRFGVGAVPSGL